jgi:hypothetical protein
VSDGVVTGGANTGTVTVTATVAGSPSTSCTAAVTNYSPIGPVVVVVDELDSTPIEGAKVVVGAEPPVTTDENGVAVISAVIDAANPQDITVSKPEYNYITLQAVETNVVIAPMSKLHHLDFSQTPAKLQAGGIKGKFDFSMIRCEPPKKTCDITVGLAGLSIPSSLAYFNLEQLIGMIIHPQIELQIDGVDSPPLPANVVMCLNRSCFKEYYTPIGVPGNRVAWGIGGKLDLADFLTYLGPVISGGEDVDMGALFSGLLALVEDLYTAMVPDVDVIPQPMVADFNDIDEDPDTFEIPNFDNFPKQDMTLKVGTDQTMTFNPPPLPVGTYDGVIVVGGVIVHGAGFVVLGIGGGTDSTSNDDPADGVVENPIKMNIAGVAGRVPEQSIQRVVIAMALNISAYSNEEGPRYHAGQVLFVDDFSGTHDLDEFLLPSQAAYDSTDKVLSVTGLPSGIDYSEAIFAGDNDTGWHILGQWATGDYTLPVDPDPDDPRSSRASIICVDLIDGLDYQELVEFNSDNIGDLPYLVKAFSYAEVEGP